MKYLKTYNIFNESNHYEETSWTATKDGKDITIKISDVQDYIKNNPVIEIPVDEIKHKCIHLGKTDKETLERSEASDLKYPIIITNKIGGGYGMILDGHHRLLKAINNDIPTIKAKLLDLNEAPDDFKFMFK
jgi:hypothetical protein